MKLLTLQLENLRSYEQYSYDFENSGCLLIIGPNGIGKTNFLEAVYLLSLGKSFRTNAMEDMLKWGSDYFRCLGTIEQDEETTQLEVSFLKAPQKKKNFKINGVPHKGSEYIGNFLTVLFHPEDLNILYLSPSLRRRYCDILLSQTSRVYLQSLGKYKRLLKQRNTLLSQIREQRFKNLDTSAHVASLESWDQQISGHAAQIISSRYQLTEFLKERLPTLYRSISGADEEIELKYSCSAIKGLTTADLSEIQAQYLETLQEKRNRDIISAKTSRGPHRDDLHFFINGKEITRSASRGEFRSLVLAIKLAEIDFIKEQTGSKPLLLLDDVFSELDPDRQKSLVEAIKDCQTIITTTEFESASILAKQPNLTVVRH